VATARNPRRQPRAGKLDRKRVLGRYDAEAGVWLVPVSDAWLDMLRGDWSPPVQLKANTADGGESYTIKVRQPSGPDVMREVAHAIEQAMHRIKAMPPGPQREHEIMFAVERGFGTCG
jgi:hypothetical protein